MFVTRKQLTYENERLERRIEWLSQDFRRLLEEHYALLNYLNLEIETVDKHVRATKKK